MSLARNVTLVISAALGLTALAGFLRPYSVTVTAVATATPTQAWNVISSLENYPDWNPSVASLQGEAIVGSSLALELKSHGTTTTFSPDVLIATPNEELRWRGVTGVRGIADGEHYFRIDPGPTPATVTISQGEIFRGAAVWLLAPFLNLHSEFRDSTQALVTAIESASAAPG